MTFAKPWVLALLVLVPLVFTLLMINLRIRKRALERFADSSLLVKLTGRTTGGRTFFKTIFLLAALACMITALAGPRWGSRFEEIRHKGVDIMVVVDVSPSMLSQDIKPSRLDRARQEVYDLTKVLTGDRVGLAAFAGTAFIQCPLTLDYGALDMFLSELKPDLIPMAGTDLGEAVDTACKAFDFKSVTDKVIILITDGEDNEGRGAEAARRAAEKGVKIFVYGIGTEQGAPIPVTGTGGGFMKDATGAIVMSKLDERGLSSIASIAGGRYVRSVTGDLDLDMLYFAGIKTSTEARELSMKKMQVFEERFQFFALAAFIFLVLEWMLFWTRPEEGA